MQSSGWRWVGTFPSTLNALSEYIDAVWSISSHQTALIPISSSDPEKLAQRYCIPLPSFPFHHICRLGRNWRQMLGFKYATIVI
jgi:hypothetical protein